MKRWAWVLALATLAGCGDRSPAPPAAPAGTPTAAAPEDTTLMRGKTNLFLYESGPSATTAGKPRFEVRDVEVVLDDSGAWSFNNANAIIYGRDGSETRLQAGSGYLQQASSGVAAKETLERAYLKGGVTMETGGRTIRLEDVEWLNEEGVARSDKPIVMTEGDNEITADSLVFNPDTKELVLKNARGTVYTQGAETAPAAAESAAPEQERSAEQ